jgi:hypothetical protein
LLKVCLSFVDVVKEEKKTSRDRALKFLAHSSTLALDDYITAKEKKIDTQTYYEVSHLDLAPVFLFAMSMQKLF